MKHAAIADSCVLLLAGQISAAAVMHDNGFDKTADQII